MKKQDTKEVKKEEIPPYNACNYCWYDKKGQYSEFSIYIHYKDKPNDLLCYKCLCIKCGKIKLWGEAGTQNSGYFYRRLNGSSILDFNMPNWYIVKKLKLDVDKLQDLLLSSPKRNSFILEELPKIRVEEKPQFYEPKEITEAEEIKPEDIPF